MPKGPSEFQESNALLYALDCQDQAATSTLRAMTDRELRALLAGLDRLENLIHGVQIERCPGESYEERRLHWLNSRR